MTKDEIKKALECCEKYAYCKDCPCYTYCGHELHKGALALIIEQEKEIERLKEEKKQAQIDVLKKVKERAVGLAAIETYHICNLIDELIKEVNENDLFFDKAEAEKKLEVIRNGNKN